MSTPLSTSTTTNEYIDLINSEFSFQLAEMTVFQFPDSDQCKFRISFTLEPEFNSHGTRRLYPHDTRWQSTAKAFIMACLDAYMSNLT